MEKLKVLLTKLNKSLILINILFIIFYIILLDRYPAMWGDEGEFSNSAYNLASGNGLIISTYVNVWGFNIFNFDEGPIFYLMFALFFKVFGFGLIQGRLFSVILGIFGLNVFYFLCKELFSKKKSLLLTILFGTMPIYFIAAREIRFEIIYSVFDLLSFYFLVRYFKTEKKVNRYIIYMSIFSALSLLTHPNGMINIAATLVCLVFFNIKLTFKGIFSKNLLQSFKENIKNILIYAIIIGLIALPYVIIIIVYYNIYIPQTNYIIYSSGSNIVTNILSEYLQIKNLLISFAGTSLPRLMRIAIYLVMIGIIALIVVTLFIRSYDDPFIKITFLYLVISVASFTLIVNHKWDVYLTTVLPQFVIGFGSFMDRKPSRFNGLSGWYHQLLIAVDKLKSIFQKNLTKKISIPLIICAGFIGINVYSCELNTYDNRNCDPTLIRSELLAAGINSTDKLLGDFRFWIPVYDFNYVDIFTFFLRMKYENQSFNSIMTEIKPTIILFEDVWRTSTGYQPFATAIVNFIQHNCTLLRTINITTDGTTQWQSLFPIEVYATNFR
ncbi:MAG TPA: glycosyltransferase family 39 protein [Candidatus Lokiarchaeia archaeon]|nr:glycosyltransferase family 39 protein [Candidatus Lokiarchaeia archaeon]